MSFIVKVTQKVEFLFCVPLIIKKPSQNKTKQTLPMNEVKKSGDPL